MKFIIAAFAFAAAALASPHNYGNGGGNPPPPPPAGCTPATYSCLPNNSGWQVCSTAGQWVFAGTCPPNTVCEFYAPSGSPYCVPPGTVIS